MNETIITTDKFMGTPMKQLDSGASVVELNPTRYTQFITINKLMEGSKTAKDENVETYENFLFEIDDESLEQQKERAKRLFDQKIINRAVYSGSKSIHCRITLSNPPENKQEYKFIWKKLNEEYFDNKADTACSNPARLTRYPNAIRSSNGIKQQRLYLSESVFNYSWNEEYLKDKILNDYINQFMAIRYSVREKTPPDILLKRNIPIEAKKLLTNSFSDGERHKEIPKAISFLVYCRYELNEIEQMVKATGINDSKDYVKKLYNHGLKGLQNKS